MKLVIAEKPSVAKSIASILNAKQTNGYYKSEQYVITNAFGHLYTLANCKDYEEKFTNWNLNNFPFIPSKFEYMQLDNEGVKKQIKLINNLISNYNITEIINGCDCDREGELIFNEILDNLENKEQITKVKRLWLSSHTPNDVLRGFDDLDRDTIGLRNAGYARQHLDWLIGINHTTCLSCVQDTKLTVGRVILATLKLIYDRDYEIKNFKESKNYSLKVRFNSNGKEYSGLYIDNNQTKYDINQKPNLESIKDNLHTGFVKSIKSKETSKSPRKLFNLTDLQGFISTSYNEFDSDKVLKVCQSLYEKKYITYPRTNSRALDNSQIEEVKTTLNLLSKHELYNNYKTEFKEDKRIFNSEEVDSHPAIIPTYIIPNLKELTQDERIVYLEISKCFIAQFMDKARYIETELITEVNNYDFISKSKVLTHGGFTELYKDNDTDKQPSNKGEETDLYLNFVNLNDFKEGDNSSVVDNEILEIKSKPKKQYTEETLLKSMENCGKSIKESEEDIKQILSGYSIGTPATRAETIKKLINLKYIEMKKKSILITDNGRELISVYPVKRLLDSDFTGSIEKKLKEIENGKLDAEFFINDIKKLVIESTKEIKGTSKSSNFINKEGKEVIGVCPKCNKNIYENKISFYCEGYKEGCKFSLFKEDKYFSARKKTINKKIAKDLLSKGKTKLKLVSKEGKEYNAIINADFNNQYPKYSLEFVKDKKKGVN